MQLPNIQDRKPILGTTLFFRPEYGFRMLVDAVADGHKERAKIQAVHGKTWNHPTIAHGKLFIRNGEEMAGYELTLEPKP